jgi:transcriptional regulator with XRE-family HTH domain
MSTQRAERIPPLTLGWRLKMALGNDPGSVQKMAAYLGVSRATLSRWMGDKGTPPKRAYIAQWSLQTGVPMEWLEQGIEPHDDDGGSAMPVKNGYRTTRPTLRTAA